MSNIQDAEIEQELKDSVGRARVLVPVEGSILFVLGVVALILPGLAAIAVTILLGWLFLFSGLVGLAVAMSSHHLHGTRWSVVSSVVALVAGFALMVWPIENVTVLMRLLGLYLVADGLFSVLYASDHRRQMTGRWVWMMASGIVTLVLAGYILSGADITAAWLGRLVGIDLVVSGAALVAVGTGLKAEA